jgi:hypothetical protein
MRARLYGILIGAIIGLLATLAALAVSNSQPPVRPLLQLRALAARHAEALKAALKMPDIALG